MWKHLVSFHDYETGKEISSVYRKNLSMNPYRELRAKFENGTYTIREHYGDIISTGSYSKKEDILTEGVV